MRRRYYDEVLFRIENFAGGINLRDAPDEIAPNESPDLWNVTLDERGGVAARLGYTLLNTIGIDPSLISNGFYWAGGTDVVWQAGATLYRSGGTFKTFTTSARCAFAEFAGKLCFAHPVDGFFTYDGTTVTAIGAGPKADAMAVWQNKLWTNDKSGTHPTRLNFCAAGDPTTWPGTNDLREKDDAQVVALAGISGVDIIGRPGLLVFKRRSTYRVNDSTTGAYTTLDATTGAMSALAVTSCMGRVFVLSERGIFETNGDGSLVQRSGKLDPLFNERQLNVNATQIALACAGSVADRAYFSVATNGNSANSLMIEYHPAEEWFTLNSNAASCYVRYGNDAERLWNGSPTVVGQAQQQLLNQDDNGTAITSYYQTGWFQPNGDLRVRMNRLRVNGRGTPTLQVRTDYGTTNTLTRSPALPTSGIGYANPDVLSLGVAKAVAFRFENTSSNIFFTPALFNGGRTDFSGSWALYGLDLLHIPLGQT